MKNKLGLVLAGGGGKGAYHIGVWRALREYGVEDNIENISGTSIGALNALLFALGDYERAEATWLNLDYEQVMPLNVKTLLLALAGIGINVSIQILSVIASSGIFTRKGLLSIMNDMDLTPLQFTTKKIFAGAFNVSKLRMEYLQISGKTPEMIQKILLASSALPIIYPAEIIDGDKYLDGGLSDNVPLEPLYRDGCRNFLVVHLGRDSIVKNRHQYRDANILEIVPSDNQGDFISGTMDFSRQGISRRIEQGYNDACNILKPLYNMGMTQMKITMTLESMKQSEQSARDELAKLSAESKRIKQQREDLKNLLRKEFDL